jgi:hypothetical protein
MAMVIEPEVLILHDLASGVLAWCDRPAAPYPSLLLRSFNRLLGYQIQQGLPVTPSVVHLLDQGRSPLGQWLGSAIAALEPGLDEETLLIGNEPTDICLDWAIASPHPTGYRVYISQRVV